MAEQQPCSTPILFPRNDLKFYPLKNYERTWQRIVSALAQNDYCLTRQESRHKQLHISPEKGRRTEPRAVGMQIYTPGERADKTPQRVVHKNQPSERTYESTRLFSNNSKALNRRRTDCINDLQILKTELQEKIPIPLPDKPVQLKRPLSSFQRDKMIKIERHPESSKTITRTTNNKTYARPFIPPSGMTAYSYIVMELPEQHIHVSWNSQTSLEIASLTKIMTCMVVLRLLQETQGEMEQTVEVGAMECGISGTSASLERGFRYSVEQLLYGLMLPSGNDASLALAIWGGHILFNRQKNNEIEGASTETSLSRLKKRDAIILFVRQMNRVALEVGLKKTIYSNPHGLSTPQNKSTALDQSILCQYAMKNPIFRKIVSTTEYRSQAFNRQGISIEIRWENTHKLLHKSEYMGVKTGFTTTAGSCLASHLRLQFRQFVIVVLKCKKLERRFRDTEILKKWLMRKENLQIDTDKPNQLCSQTLQNDDFEKEQMYVEQYM